MDCIINIARVCHEVNKAYCESLGDFSQVPWTEAPEWQKKSAVQGVTLHFDGKAGVEASHESWMQSKLDDGWEYGEIKDPARKQHPCLVPFEELPVDQQAKDHIFRGVVHALAISGWDYDTAEAELKKSIRQKTAFGERLAYHNEELREEVKELKLRIEVNADLFLSMQKALDPKEKVFSEVPSEKGTRIRRVEGQHNLRVIIGSEGPIEYDVREILCLKQSNYVELMEQMAIFIYDRISKHIKSKPEEDDGRSIES